MATVKSNASKKVGYLWRATLIIPLFLGLFISLSDALILILCGVFEQKGFLSILEPLAAKMIIIVALYSILWFVLLYPLVRVFKLDVKVLSVSLAVFFTVMYMLYILLHLLYSREFIPDSFLKGARAVLIICSSASIVSFFLWATNFLMKLVFRSKWRALIAVVCLTIPLLLAETIVALWIKRCFSGSFFIAAVIFTAYIAGIVVTLTMFVRIRDSRAPVRIFQIFALLVFTSSILVSIFGTEKIVISRESVRAGRPVKHVILILVDTLRADALSCYGGQRISTPHIDRLAADGILFKKAFSPGPWTKPSMASVMTGLSPLVHMTNKLNSVLPDVLPTLAEYMRDAGYLTHAIGENPVLTGSGFQQGFIGYNFFPKRIDFSPCGQALRRLFPKKYSQWAPANKLTRLAIDWLKANADNDFFLWIHYYDPHVPYAPPAEYLADKKPAPGMGNYFGPIALASIRSGFLALSLEQREWLRTLYDSEVRYVDDNIGLLIDHLKKLKIYNDTLIVLTSDHGEEFWEHGGCEHGHTLYNEVLQVPLIVKLIGSSSKETVAQPVSIGSIAPTVLELCKIKYNSDYMSRGPLVLTRSTHLEADDAEPIVSTGMLYYEEKESVIFDGQKDIRFLVTGLEEFYDLINDPGENVNIAHTAKAKVKKAGEILNECHQTAKKLKRHYSIDKGEEEKMDADMMQELRTLGYID